MPLLYRFATFPDGTEVNYSEVMHDDDGREMVRIYMERWDKGIRDFDTLEIYIPSMRITKQGGYTQEETEWLMQHIESLSDMIFEMAHELEDTER